MWHTKRVSWFGCVCFGAFFFPLSIFGRRLCFRKLCLVGLYRWKTVWSCSLHMPQAWTPQTPAPRRSTPSISVTDFIVGFSSESANKFQMWWAGFLDASYLSIGSRRIPLVWATHNWQMAVTSATDEVGRIQFSLEEKETIIPFNNFLCSTQSFY